MTGSTAAMMLRSIISSAAGKMPSPMIDETAALASSIVSKIASNVRVDSGRCIKLTTIFVAIASVPSEPTNAPIKS